MRRICADYPGAYWRKLDDEEAYPAQFVQAMTEAGYLAALIPEEHGGAGLPLRAAGVILEPHAVAGTYYAARSGDTQDRGAFDISSMS